MLSMFFYSIGGNNMKKITFVLFFAFLVSIMAACGDNSKETSSSSSSSSKDTVIIDVNSVSPSKSLEDVGGETFKKSFMGNSPVFIRDEILVTFEGGLKAYEWRTGQFLWEYDLGDSTVKYIPDASFHSTFLAEDYVFYGKEGEMYRVGIDINPENNSHEKIEIPLISRFHVDGSTVYAQNRMEDDRAKIFSFDANTLDIHWETELENVGSLDVFHVSDNYVIIDAGVSFKAVVLNAGTGEILYEEEGKSAYFHGGISIGEDVYLIRLNAGETGTVFHINPNTGEKTEFDTIEGTDSYSDVTSIYNFEDKILFTTDQKAYYYNPSEKKLEWIIENSDETSGRTEYVRLGNYFYTVLRSSDFTHDYIVKVDISKGEIVDSYTLAGLSDSSSKIFPINDSSFIGFIRDGYMYYLEE